VGNGVEVGTNVAVGTGVTVGAEVQAARKKVIEIAIKVCFTASGFPVASAFESNLRLTCDARVERRDVKLFSTPTTPEAAREMKTTSNYAKKLRKPVLTLNEVKGKDGVVGVRVFPDVQVHRCLTAGITCRVGRSAVRCTHCPQHVLLGADING
jgi:hypothetical protein